MTHRFRNGREKIDDYDDDDDDDNDDDDDDDVASTRI